MHDGADDAGQPRLVRVTHWINAIAMIIMIGSGWRIYNDSPLIHDFFFDNTFTLGGDPATSDAKWQNHASGGLQWHFAAMWVLVLNGLVYYAYGFWSGRFKTKLWPIEVREVIANITDALQFKLTHEAGVYNHVQRILYIGVMSLGVIVVVSGLAMWKPVQFQVLYYIFGTFQAARWVHFLAMTGIVLFLIVHVVLALLVPSTLLTMLGFKPKHSELQNG